MSRKTRAPMDHEELLDLPRHSERWAPVPVRLKVAVCHLCGNWTIRRGQNSVSDERAVSGHLRQGSIRWRSYQSIGDRPVCEECHQAENQMDQEEAAEAVAQAVAPIESGVSNVA